MLHVLGIQRPCARLPCHLMFDCSSDLTTEAVLEASSVLGGPVYASTFFDYFFWVLIAALLQTILAAIVSYYSPWDTGMLACCICVGHPSS